MSRSRGRYEESRREKDKETEEDTLPKHEKHPPFRSVSLGGIFNCKIGGGDSLRLLTQAYPRGVRAKMISGMTYAISLEWMGTSTSQSGKSNLGDPN